MASIGQVRWSAITAAQPAHRQSSQDRLNYSLIGMSGHTWQDPDARLTHYESVLVRETQYRTVSFERDWR
jgi:hypothetical protein